MPDYRHAGTFWPANAGGEHPNVDTILGLPGSESLIFVVADSARYWWPAIKARAKLAVWRGLPRPDRLPAMLGWDGNRVADECMNLFDEVEHSGTEWFTPLNELQFVKESGQPFAGYADMALKLARLRLQLRRKFAQKYAGVDIRMLFPAWVPSDDLERSHEWLDEAMQWDGLRVHIYNNANEVRSRYWAHRNLLIDRYGERGRTFPILVDETNANHTGADEREMLIANAEVCRDDPHCLGFNWFIWETNNAGERDLSIWGNPDRLALFRDPPSGSVFHPSPEEPKPEPAPTPPIVEPAPVPPEPEPTPMTPYEQFCRAEAARRGIDPDIAVRVANSEGSLTEPARRGTFNTGSSWWAFQLHYGGAGYEYLGTVAGMGNEFSLVTGWAPGDPEAWRDAMRWALDRAKWSGWGPWYGAAAVGIDVWDGIDRTAGWEVTPADEWDYVSGAVPAPPIVPPALTYNPSARVNQQPDQWSCAIESTAWLLRSIGRNPSREWLEATMVPAVVSRDVGLLDASGRGLAELLTREYGSEMGFEAQHDPDISFDHVAEIAGWVPVLIGGRSWGAGGHWSGVRRADENGWLDLANPVAGYTGVGTHLNRAEWDARGPWSAVWVATGEPVVVEPAPAPADPRDAEITQLRLELADKDRRLSEVVSLLGVARGDIADAVGAAERALRALVPSS